MHGMAMVYESTNCLRVPTKVQVSRYLPMVVGGSRLYLPNLYPYYGQWVCMSQRIAYLPKYK